MPGGRLVRMDCSSACRSLTLFELRATFLYGHNARADVERPMSGWHQKGPPAVVAGGPEITSKTAAKSPSSWYYIGKGTSESAAVDVEGGSRSTVQRRLQTSLLSRIIAAQPARYGGRAALILPFLPIYLRKLNTTVLDAAHRAVFCCLATSLGPQPTSQSSGPGRASAAPAMLPLFLWSRRSNHRRRAG